ncbi:M23 family metallopeptidase [Bacillaceae bacterium S4-13-56]
MFIKPCTGRLTSGYRTKERPDHAGVDWADSGAVPILSAADGAVSLSRHMGSYGEVIFLIHDIDGDIYETVYAHLSKRNVTYGKRISKGERIGWMGSTGNSTGQHLHFEIHKDRWNSQRTGSVDPLLYIGEKKTHGGLIQTERTLFLPSTASSWRVYDPEELPIKGNQKAFLNPAKFGGLTYKILDETEPHVYLIKTKNFGLVKIYAHPSTGAIVR